MKLADSHRPKRAFSLYLAAITTVTILLFFYGIVSVCSADDWKSKQGFFYNADHFYYFGCRFSSFESRFGIEKNHYRIKFRLTAAANYEWDDKIYTRNTQYKFMVELSWSPRDHQVEERITIQAEIPHHGMPRVKATQVGECPVDPVLYSSGGRPPTSYSLTSFTGSLYTLSSLKADENEMDVLATTNEANWMILPSNLLTLVFIAPQTALDLRHKYEVWTAASSSAPFITSPKENAEQNNSGKIPIRTFWPGPKTWPCDWWKYVIVINRWDPAQGSNGGWTDGPHSYDNFWGYDDKGTCRGEHQISLKPGRYRIRCRAEHRRPDVPSTPWSYWIEFRVSPGISSQAAEHLMHTPHITAPKLGQPAPWYPGDNHSVRWHSFSIPGKVRIFLVRGKTAAALLNANRFEWSLPGGVANNGYWRRNLPRNLPPDEHYRVLVQSVDNPDVKGFSEFFPVRMKMNAAAFKGIKKKHLTHIPAGVHIQPHKKPTIKPGAAAPTASLRFLKLTSPRGMETWYLGETHAITWKAGGIEGRIRIVLEDRHGKKQTLNGLAGTDVTKGRFNWKIGSNIKPGSMYKIYLKTADGKVQSHKSGGFNIKMKLASGSARRLPNKKTGQLKKPPGKKLRHLN